MKTLNITTVKAAMDKIGLNPSAVSKELDISREAVSQWFKGNSFPRPDKLLKLALLLDLKSADIILKDDLSEPVIAFRKRAGTKTKETHISHAKEMGNLLKPLVKYLPFDKYVRPKTLKAPSTDYTYLQDVSLQIRKEIGLNSVDNIDFRHLIKLFGEKQTVLIPVLWGKKEKHENALHIFLPDSMTTWVYLNLDVEIHDFKFWMAHELGHVLSPNLLENAGEDFADAFAGALLFPIEVAKDAYGYIQKNNNPGAKINKIKEIAEKHLISPITVYYETNKYAKHEGLPELKLNTIFAAAKNLSNSYYTVSESLFDEEHPETKKYIEFSDNILDSPFFCSLKEYLISENKSSGYIQSILDISLIDSKEIHSQLT